MQQPYTKEQLQEIFKELPQELKDAMGSAENTDAIFEIAQRNGIDVENDENIKTISELAAYVLMGLMLPSDFERELCLQINLKPAIAQKIATEINRFVFYPVKPSLEQLHNMGGGKTEKPAEASAVPEEKPEEKPREPQREDKYKEQIE